MLKFITDIADKLLSYVKDDPVRPEIPADYRVSNNRFIAALVDQEQPTAMVCISLHDDVIPEDVVGLDSTSTTPTTAVFYTIWSYSPGAGRSLLNDTVKEIKVKYPTVTRFVTLSPKTEMAKRFHLKNGAAIFRENPNTVNYEYF